MMLVLIARMAATSFMFLMVSLLMPMAMLMMMFVSMSFWMVLISVFFRRMIASSLMSFVVSLIVVMLPFPTFELARRVISMMLFSPLLTCHVKLTAIFIRWWL